MSISPILHVPALGIHRNIERLNAAAAEIAKPENLGAVRPIAEMIVAKHGAQANINTFKSVVEMDRNVLDILG